MSTPRTLTTSSAALAAIAAALLAGGCGGSSHHHPETYSFATMPASAYTRADRMGMPAVNTAVITSKDAYNAKDPTDDAAGMFVSEITTNVHALRDALSDDLTAAGLHPATGDQGITQAAPLVVPDVLKIDTTMAAGFPNGRRLTDPVMDVILAVVLLDLNQEPVTRLAALPLNPPANDVPFSATFPYLAAPH